VARRWVTQSPGEPNSFFWAGRLDRELGERRFFEGRYDEALQLFQLAEENLSKSLQLKPRNPAARNAVCDATYFHAFSLDRLGRHEEAKEVLEESINARRALVDEFPNVPLFQERARQGLPPLLFVP
jgi:tetratricopeptide (TPR) repeat protein